MVNYLEFLEGNKSHQGIQLLQMSTLEYHIHNPQDILLDVPLPLIHNNYLLYKACISVNEFWVESTLLDIIFCPTNMHLQGSNDQLGSPKLDSLHRNIPLDIYLLS